MGVFFNLYGDNAVFSLIGFAVLFAAAVIINEVAKRTKTGDIIFFMALPCALTIYFVVLNILAASGVSSAQKNYTYVYKNDWYDYIKLYAAVLGAVGFFLLRRGIGLGKKSWFKILPFLFVSAQLIVCVGIELNIAVTGDKFYPYTGWWDVINAVAGFMNIFCFTGRGYAYLSKDGRGVLCPNLTRRYMAAFSVWYITFMYSCAPSECWYGGLAVILAVIFAEAFLGRGGWMQNYAKILTLWYMFSAVVPVLRPSGSFYTTASYISSSDMSIVGGMAIVSFAVNFAVLASVIARGIKLHKNPYENEIFIDTPYYKAIMERAGKE